MGRCKICPDAIGEMADVSCPDGWLFDPKAQRYSSDESDNPGQNLVLCRTAKGEELVRECAAAGDLVLSPLEVCELEQMHQDHYPRKCLWPLRLLAKQYCPEDGIFRPLKVRIHGHGFATMVFGVVLRAVIAFVQRFQHSPASLS